MLPPVLPALVFPSKKCTGLLISGYDALLLLVQVVGLLLLLLLGSPFPMAIDEAWGARIACKAAVCVNTSPLRLEERRAAGRETMSGLERVGRRSSSSSSSSSSSYSFAPLRG